MNGYARLAPTYYDAVTPQDRRRSVLTGRIEADVAVVGAGFAGACAALRLAQGGARVVLLEAAEVGAGASGRNGGQLHTGLTKDQDWLEARHGEATARALWRLAEEAKALVPALMRVHDIKAQLRTGLLHAAWKRGEDAIMARYAAFMAERYGYAYLPVSKADMPTWVASGRYHGGLYDPGGGHLNPLCFVRGLADAAEDAGATIFEGSAVRSVEPDAGGATLRTAEGEVRAKAAALAVDTWLDAIAPHEGGYAMPINSFIAVTEPLGEARAAALIPSGAAVSDTKFVIDYYRVTPDGRLLFGGGENYSPRYPKNLEAFVRKPMLRVFPQLEDARIEFVWGGPVGVTMSRLPHLGRIAPNVVFAHGFSGQGVAVATLAGELMAEALTGRPERFDVLAGLKHRRFPGGRYLRAPLTAAGMAWFALRDRF